MERRGRKRPQQGKVIFYEPTFEYKDEKNLLKNLQQQAVLAMMKAFGATHQSMKVTISESNEGDFSSFYKKAIEDIITKVKSSPKSGDARES